MNVQGAYTILDPSSIPNRMTGSYSFAGEAPALVRTAVVIEPCSKKTAC